MYADWLPMTMWTATMGFSIAIVNSSWGSWAQLSTP
jgi:hypothetical protein